MPPDAPFTIRRRPFAAFDSFTPLFRDYCTRYDAVSEYYAGDFREPAERKKAAERALTVERDRDTLADVLLEQNAHWGMDDAVRANIESLRRADSVVTITGQQVGLFSGPFYTILKTITTLQTAEQLAGETGRPVVPVFWLGTEDHDFEEIASAHFLRRNEVETLTYPRPAQVGAVGRMRFDETIDELVERADAILPPSDFKAGLMEHVRTAYRSGRTFGEAFARLMAALFDGSGLVLVDASDARLKKLAVPLFDREIADPEPLSAGVQATSEKLAQHYHQQVQVRPANLFLLDDAARRAVDVLDSRFELRDASSSWSKEELADLLRRDPARFSPNVVMRPLMQDVLFPTALYVAGPSEIAYYAQYRSAYDWAGLPMPLIYPRASATLVESKVGKVIEKFGLEVDDFEDDVERLFQRVVLSGMEVDVDELFKDASRHVHEAVNTLKPEVEKVDPTLVRSAEAVRSALMSTLMDFKSKVVRAEKRSHDEVRDQLRKADVNLFPTGKPQERVISVLYFLNKYSLGLIDDLRASLSTDTTEHQVVDL